jgi:hypothetical protein
MDRLGALDRGCLRNHRLRQNVVDLAQTQVSGPSDMGSDGGFAPHFFLAGAAAEGGLSKCTSLGRFTMRSLV